MKRALITAAALEPETLANCRAQCRLDSTEEDALVTNLLQNAREAAEEYLWRRLITQTWDQYFDKFADPLRLELSPVQSPITSIKYLDANGTLQTLSSAVYELGEENGIGIVRRKYNQTWPDTRGVEDSVVVRYVVGYGLAPVNVPMMIRGAILLHVAHYFANRSGEPLPRTFYDCLAPLTARRFV